MLANACIVFFSVLFVIFFSLFLPESFSSSHQKMNKKTATRILTRLMVLGAYFKAIQCSSYYTVTCWVKLAR